MQREALGPADRVVLVDDWFETGAQAAPQMLRFLQGGL